MLAALAPIALNRSAANAASVYCQSSVPDTGTVGGITYNNIINAWADPACGGSRYQAYDAFSTASSSAYIDVDSVRAWVCGTPAGTANPPAQTTTSVETWSGWTATTNTCGFQSDQSTYFGGAVNRWTYSNIN